VEVGGELFEGEGEREAVVEATGGVAGAMDVAGEEETAKGAFGENGDALSTGPEDVGTVEFVGTDGEGGILAIAAEFEEGREIVLVILGGGTGKSEFGRGLEAVGGEEQGTLDGPGEDGWEGILKLGSEERGLLIGEFEGDGDKFNAGTKVGEGGREIGGIGCGEPEFAAGMDGVVAVGRRSGQGDDGLSFEQGAEGGKVSGGEEGFGGGGEKARGEEEGREGFGA